MQQISLAAALALALAASGPAFAATAQTQDQNSQSANAPQTGAAENSMNHNNLRQQLHDQLAKAGYTAIKIMPSSFYVQAKDKKGDPVAMVVGPDSFTEVTEIKTQANAAPPPVPAQPSQNGTPQK